MTHDEARLAEFLQGASRLPVLPQVTIRLLNAVNSPDSTAKDVGKIIEAEPSLAARALKMANSPFYGRGGRVSTIQSAVVVLGLKTVRSLALTVWTHTLRSRLGTAEDMVLLSPLLTHGLATGVVAGMLAERHQRLLAEDAYMAGLLHDIGRVALAAQLGQDYRTVILGPALRGGLPLHEQENVVLGFDHRALGAALLASWVLPRFIVDVVEHHHDAAIAPESHFLLATVALADHYASRLGYNLVKEMPRPAHDNIAAFFGLGDANAVADFLEHCMERFKVLSAVLD
jgi:HD-like signal output (HDOD) protein